MYSAHQSYTTIGLGSTETDALVALAREFGPSRGVYGAKITGGGSGGTVAFLTMGELVAQCPRDRRALYSEQTGLTSQIMLGGALPGALGIGTQTVTSGG